nr:Smr/MutS family protein [Allomuricauda sp.]
MKDFQVGDSVEVLDEDIAGTIEEIRGDQITILTQDGFPLVYQKRELVLKEQGIQVSNFEAHRIKLEKDKPQEKNATTLKPKQRNAPKMEVDLHIHQLVKSTKGLSNFDMLELQLETAKRQLEFAREKRIQKVVFIHGVGEGVLREELHYLFKKYEGLKWYDADYQKYGLGATEVYLLQNP